MEPIKGWFQVWLEYIKEVYGALKGGKAALESGGPFSGRIGIRRFWTFTLVTIVISIVLLAIEGVIFIGVLGIFVTPLSSIFGLATLIPSISAGIRRLHDIGKIGWWLLVPLYNIYLWIQKGDASENQYGPVPTDIA
ncbi:MAG: DUF805 domain-containing protein [Helicobacteraceae bacterium]|jgi:uncharacterized membrane protein YhaH (DUF805 family)|nr:DUF805 domain-containing protein [Helicobacteraceae bacterium]